MSQFLESNVLNFLKQKKGLKICNHKKNESYIFPPLTVGICVKNAEATLEACLESVVFSAYDTSKLQLIVVDGKSSDRTLDIANSVLQKIDVNFKILSDGGKGLGYARQLVVDNATGKYVCWIDGDNILPNFFLREHVEFAENNVDVGLFIPIILFRGKEILSRLEGYYWLLPTLNSIGTKKMPRLAMQGTLTPLKLLKQIGGFDASITGAGEDTELFQRMKHLGILFMVNPNARIFHVMRSSWRTLYKQVSWWAKTQPRLRKSELFQQVLKSVMTSVKQFPSIISSFKDPIGIVMPMYVIIWNGWYFIHSFK